MITAILVNYHTEKHLQELLELLKKEKAVTDVIIVDNSGTLPLDFTPHLLKPGKNLGFGRAVNLAAQKAKTPYLLVINPDVRPLSKSIELLLEGAEKTGAPLVGPRFYWDTKCLFRLPPAEGFSFFWALARAVSTRSPFDAELWSFYWRLRHLRFWEAKEPFWEPFLSGACLLVRREAFSQELFDPRFFLYFEDVDLSVRSWNKGGAFCIPQAEMIHFWDQSPPPPQGKSSLMENGAVLFLKKYYRELPNCNAPLLKEAPALNFTSLGTLKDPPSFEIPGEGFSLELALSPDFVPFAQALPPKGVFSLPAEIWHRLPQTTFYVRLVNKSGQIYQRWRFNKG